MPRWLAWFLVLFTVTACSTVTPSPSASPRPEASRLAGLPQGPLVGIDMAVLMAADNRTLTITFIGGPVLPATDPCYTGYEGWARLTGTHLDLAVVLVADVHPPPGSACAAAGFQRFVTVTLDTPFAGSTAQDLSDGHLVEIERPPS